MQLRDHPIWPPKWLDPLLSEPLSTEVSEELILKKVEIRPPWARESQHRYISISAEYGGKKYFSALTIFRDLEFFKIMYEKLSNSIGQTMREIGDSVLLENPFYPYPYILLNLVLLELSPSG